jgi:hypothetical protein
MIEEKGSSTTGPPAQDTLFSNRKKAVRAQRRVRILLRQVAIWLDKWGLRGYPQDTHDWASKVEQLRSLKNTSRHVH